MFILIGTLIQFIVGFAPLIIMILFVSRMFKAQNNKNKNQKSGENLRASNKTPQRNAENKGFLQQMKTEFQQVYEEEQQKNQRNAHVQQRVKKQQPVTQTLTSEQRAKQQRTKERLQAAQVERWRQFHTASRSLEQQPRNELRVEKTSKATSSLRTKRERKMQFDKKNLVQAMIYKEIIDKPVSIRDEQAVK